MSFQARGIGQSGGTDAQRQRIDGTRFYGQLGVAVRPVISAALEMLSLFDEHADEYVGIALLDRGTSHAEPVSSGETRLYAAGAPNVCVRLLGGLVEIRVHTGGVLKLAPDSPNYADQSVARNGDAVNAATALTAWFTSATAKLNALPGSPTPTAPITIGVIAGSAADVKA